MRLRWTPKFGRSGFGNLFNNYTWTASVVNGSLLIGTMDWSYLLYTGIASASGAPTNAIDLSGYGADLWRFDDPDNPASPEDVHGAGNYLNYGIRSMITSPDGKTGYIGTANPMNLEQEGGWELRLLKAHGKK